MEEPLIIARDGAILTVTLNRPQAHNAINRAMATGLVAVLRQLDEDPTLRLAVLKAAGPGSFCSGVDLREGGGAAFADAQGRNVVAEIIRAMRACRKLIIAQVEGAVIGGGLGLISACDLVYAAEGLKFSLPEVKVGLFPLVASSLISRQIPARKLREICYLAVPLTAAEAADYGIINRAAPQQELAPLVRETVSRLLSAAPLALATGKRALDEMVAIPPDSALAYAELQLGRLSAGAEAQEGRTAFAEKRKPEWADA